MEGYIKFYASVTKQTSVELQKEVGKMLQKGITKLHLLLSTPGGSVYDGISLYNYLKGIGIEVNTYNFGCVDSIGVVVFCAGTNRYSTPHARFLLHPITMRVMANTTFDEHLLLEKSNSLRAAHTNIINIISSTINKSEGETKKLINTRTSLESKKAKEKGLVTDIKSNIFPLGVELISIYDPPTQQGVQPMSAECYPPPIESVPQSDLTSYPTQCECLPLLIESYPMTTLISCPPQY